MQPLLAPAFSDAGIEEGVMSESNVEIMKKLFEAGPRGDIATIRACMSPDVTWITPAGVELPVWSQGTFKGIDAVLKNVIGPAAQLFENFRLEADEHIEVGNRVISTGRFRGKAKNTGKELDAVFAMFTTFKDGKIVLHRNITDTAAWLRALGLELGKRANLPLQPAAHAPH